MKKVERGVMEEKEKEGKEKEGKGRVIMKSQKFVAVKMVRDQENKCQNQEDIVLMKRNLELSALQDLLWKRKLCLHGRLAKINVRAI